MDEKKLWYIESLIEKYASKYTFEREFNTYNFSVSKHLGFIEVGKVNWESTIKPVFSDVYGSYLGLKHDQYINKDKPVYVFDNHNKILASFGDMAQEHESFDVVHIDAHRDDALFDGKKPDVLGTETVKQGLQETRISDFFDYCLEIPQLQNIHRITDSQAFESFIEPQHPFMLSLDIDIFGPEGDFVDIETVVKNIVYYWSHADVVAIATSPGFIDQVYAKQIILLLLSQLN